MIGQCTDIRPVHVWSLEKDPVARDGLIIAGRRRSPTPCAFDNLTDLLPPGVWRRRCGLVKGCPELPPAKLHEFGLAHAQLRDAMPCKAHNCHHQPRHTDIHCAGTSCQDHSSFGSLKGNDGKQVKYVLIWYSLRLKLQPTMILHENVSGFGVAGLTQHLGRLYVVIPCRMCASEFGLPISRDRQMTILVLREWAFARLRAIGRTDLCTDTALERLVDLISTIRACWRRTCGITWRDCLVSTDDDHAEEHHRNAIRPTVVRRWRDVDAGATMTVSAGGATLPLYGDDRRDSAMGALYPSERHRLDELMLLRKQVSPTS